MLRMRVDCATRRDSGSAPRAAYFVRTVLVLPISVLNRRRCAESLILLLRYALGETKPTINERKRCRASADGGMRRKSDIRSRREQMEDSLASSWMTCKQTSGTE